MKYLSLTFALLLGLAGIARAECSGGSCGGFAMSGGSSGFCGGGSCSFGFSARRQPLFGRFFGARVFGDGPVSFVGGGCVGGNCSAFAPSNCGGGSCVGGSCPNGSCFGPSSCSGGGCFGSAFCTGGGCLGAGGGFSPSLTPVSFDRASGEFYNPMEENVVAVNGETRPGDAVGYRLSQDSSGHLQVKWVRGRMTQDSSTTPVNAPASHSNGSGLASRPVAASTSLSSLYDARDVISVAGQRNPDRDRVFYWALGGDNRVRWFDANRRQLDETASESPAPAQTTATAPATVTPSVPPAAVAEAPPEITLITGDTWCIPCMRLRAALDRARRRFSDVVNVANDEGSVRAGILSACARLRFNPAGLALGVPKILRRYRGVAQTFQGTMVQDGQLTPELVAFIEGRD